MKTKILSFLFFCMVNHLTAVSPLTEEIDLLANHALKEFKVPGVAIAIVVDDQIHFARGYGTRKLDEALPVTAETLFPIASCTKAFTATLLGQLVDEGKVAWDDPVKKYIPEFALQDPALGQQVTIRDLLAHRSGVIRHDAIWIASEIPRTSILELIQHLDPGSTFRKEFQYNNFLYAVAGIVVERVTGQSWEKAVTTRLLMPLEMKASSVLLKQLQISLDYSYPHAIMDGKLQTISFLNTYSVNPGSGIISNVLDMANWIRLQLSDGKFLDRMVIQPTTLAETHSIQIPLSPPKVNNEVSQHGYGLGWYVAQYRGHTVIHHGGTTEGFASEVALLPESNMGVVILTNSSSDGHYIANCLRNHILDAFLGLSTIDWVTEIQKGRMVAKQALQSALDGLEKIKVPSKTDLSSYVGTYEAPGYGLLQISLQEGQLYFAYGKIKMPLYFKEGDTFSGKTRFLELYGINPVMDVTFHHNKVEVPFEGFRGFKPITFIRK